MRTFVRSLLKCFKISPKSFCIFVTCMTSLLFLFMFFNSSNFLTTASYGGKLHMTTANPNLKTFRWSTNAQQSIVTEPLSITTVNNKVSVFQGETNSNSIVVLTNSPREAFLIKLENRSNETNSTLNQCDLISRHLVGYKPYNLTELKKPLTEKQVTEALSSQKISIGGKWSPVYCKARYYVAIIIPYRNREEHLKLFLLHMHPIFARQELSYKIYIIEPVANITFNRGLLMNIGFIESNKDAHNQWDCHSYHDVDLISEDDRTLYSCPESPTHMSHRISKFKYKPLYATLFGGITIIRKEQYNISNGYSNQFFGWGGEDDDHYSRLVSKGFKPISPPEPFGRYYMFSHSQDKPNPHRHAILNHGIKTSSSEGLNSAKYKVLETVFTPLYTKILVYYNQSEILPPELVRNLTQKKKAAKKLVTTTKLFTKTKKKQ